MSDYTNGISNPYLSLLVPLFIWIGLNCACVGAAAIFTAYGEVSMEQMRLCSAIVNIFNRLIFSRRPVASIKLNLVKNEPCFVEYGAVSLFVELVPNVMY